MEQRSRGDWSIQVVGMEEYQVLKTEEARGRCGKNGHTTRTTTGDGVRQCVECGVMLQFKDGTWRVVVRQSRRRRQSGDWTQNQLFQEQ